MEANYNRGMALYAPNEDEKKRFIKNNVMKWLVMASVEKKLLIPHTNVLQLAFEGNDGDDAWMVWS